MNRIEQEIKNEIKHLIKMLKNQNSLNITSILETQLNEYKIILKKEKERIKEKL